MYGHQTYANEHTIFEGKEKKKCWTRNEVYTCLFAHVSLPIPAHHMATTHQHSEFMQNCHPRWWSHLEYYLTGNVCLSAYYTE